VLANSCRSLPARSARDYDVEIIEMHHKHKVDAPPAPRSRWGDAAARGSGRDSRPPRCTAAKWPHRRTQERHHRFRAPFAADMWGRAHVIFAGSGERIELTHRATSRQNFASRRAARCAVRRRAPPERERTPALRHARDVLALR
jgi:4-hydroxy-tetrahydrodipicolinate reductase